MTTNETNKQARRSLRQAVQVLVIMIFVFLLSAVFLGKGAITFGLLTLTLAVGWYVVIAKRELTEPVDRHRRREIRDFSGVDIKTSVSGLGSLFLDEDSELWIGHPLVDHPEVEVCLFAEWQGDEVQQLAPELRQAASLIVSSYDEFESKVSSFLQDEVDARPEIVRHAAEAAGLTISRLSFLWRERPDDLVVHLAGGTGGRYWMCEWSKGQPVTGSLGFDT